MRRSDKTIRAIGLYSLILGASVFLVWIFMLTANPLQEGHTEMAFHLTSEWLMASLCMGSGFCLIRGLSAACPVNLAAHSMMIYSLLNAAGYYAERGEGISFILFICLLIPSVLIVSFHMHRTAIASTPA